MVSEEDVATRRKRVRSGCLTCRGRRRKCDEGKPVCSNCKSKNLTCRYGVNVTFVQSRFQQFPGVRTPVRDTPVDKSEPQPDSTSSQRDSSSTDLFHVDDRAPVPQPELQAPIYERHHERTQPLQTSTEASSYRPSPRPDSIALRDTRDLFDKPVAASISVNRDQYEIELLTFYRYNLAPMLDLGLGSLFFGIEAVLDATHSEAVYNAVLALASSRRAASCPPLQMLDEATSISCAHFATQAIDTARHHESMTTHVLLTCRALLSAPIEAWGSLTLEIRNIAQYACDDPDHWMLLVRLLLSTVLVTGSSGSNDSLPPLSSGAEIACEPMKQLYRALQLLQQTLHYWDHGSPQPNMTDYPVQAWLSRWQDVQDWHTDRPDVLLQLFELSDADTSEAVIRDELSFPCVVFSSACAVVANVAVSTPHIRMYDPGDAQLHDFAFHFDWVWSANIQKHHVAAMILLQNKPRLAKASACYGSSTSILWHAQRTLGIIISATDADVWDPFLVAALVFTAQNLSHNKQVRAVDETLRQLSSMSGLRLNSAVLHLGGSENYG